jgi:predicted ferric reductase
MQIKKIAFIVFLPLITLIIWFIDRLVNQIPFNSNLLLTYLMQIAGLTGISLMSLNFILASRWRFIENIFGGFDKSFRIHAKVGRYAFGILLLHPLFGILRSLGNTDAVLRYIIPSLDITYTGGIITLWTLSILIGITLGLKLPYHIWKQTHRLMILALVFALLHAITNTYSAFNIANISTVWIILMAGTGILAYIYREFIYERFGSVFQYKVDRINPIGGITEIYLKPISKRLIFKAGQYNFVSILDNPKIIREFHPFSISSAPNDEYIRISAKNLGDYTSTLQYLNPGNLVKLIGPNGKFTQENLKDSNAQIWLAGGIGVTPFLSMLKDELNNKETNRNILFIYSCKNETEAVYRDEIMSIANQLPHVQIKFHYSEAEGFLTYNYIKKLFAGNINETLFMICGPAPMMNGLRKNFMQNGIQDENIVFENFSFK